MTTTMSNQSEIPMLDNAQQEANVWINEIADGLGEEQPRTAYHALRGVFFALRDRIIPEEAVHLGDQLPVLLRGVYYESYNLGGKPEKLRNIDAFLGKIREEISKTDPEVDAETAFRVVMRVLKNHIADGQYEQVKHGLTKDIQELAA